jgi:toxin secretion/phage lysis holin
MQKNRKKPSNSSAIYSNCAGATAGERKIIMNNNQIKVFFTAVFSLLSSLFGALAIPVLLMVACNLIDYITGLMASTYRDQDINSYKSIRGIMKKVGMWLLVVVGAIIDQLLVYASDTIGITLPFTFLVACIVALWIICNEIISILENLKDMGVVLPAFLRPIVDNIKSQVEQMGDKQAEDTASKNNEE